MDFKVFFRNCKLGIFQKFSNVSEKLIEYFFWIVHCVSKKHPRCFSYNSRKHCL